MKRIAGFWKHMEIVKEFNQLQRQIKRILKDVNKKITIWNNKNKLNFINSKNQPNEIFTKKLLPFNSQFIQLINMDANFWKI